MVLRNKEIKRLVLEAAEELTGNRYRKSDANLMLDATVYAIEKALADGNDVAIHGFGRFVVHHYKDREIVNPKGERAILPAYKGVKFHAGDRLRREVAEGYISLGRE